MQLIERAMQDPAEQVRLIARGNDFVVHGERCTIITRLVEGRFPRWREVVPRHTQGIRIELTVGPLLAALRQAAIVASNDSRGIDFSFGNGLLSLSGLTADTGESHVELPITYDGTPITLCLDNRFMVDFLRVLDPELTFTLSVQDADSAALCETSDGYAYVVMPMAHERPGRG
jgi:DNA polymerase-3 subunit beta